MQTISINKRLDYSAPILFVPLSYQVQKGKPSAVKLTTPKVAATKVPAKQAMKGKPAPATTKKPTTIATSAKATGTKATPVIEKKDLTIAKADVKKVEQPKTAPVDTKKDLKVEQHAQKETAQPTLALAKALDIKQAVVPIEQPKEAPAIESVQPQADKAVEYEVNNGAIVSNNYREVEALRRGAQLQKELVHKWHPPIGVSPDCTCEISFFVNNKGTIENLKMVKSSGVIMFDISARQALFAMKMPQWTYGNPLTIHFKQ